LDTVYRRWRYVRRPLLGGFVAARDLALLGREFRNPSGEAGRVAFEHKQANLVEHRLDGLNG
jgi:hypothetical protein